MNTTDITTYADRLKAAQAARKATLAKFRPRVAAPAAAAIDRSARKAAALVVVRAELGAKRAARKERKSLSQAEAKAKRDARYAARKARK